MSPGARDGAACSISAITPATCGAANEVPLTAEYCRAYGGGTLAPPDGSATPATPPTPPSAAGLAATIPSPGAVRVGWYRTSSKMPREEKDDRRPSRPVEPTPITHGATA